MISIKCSPLRGVLATIIYRRHALPTVPSRFSCGLLLTAVVLHKAFPDIPARLDWQNTILDTVLSVEGNRVVSATASRKKCAREHGDGAEVLGSTAGETVAHSTTVGKSKREAQILIYTEIVLNLLADRVEESDVLSALIAPALVQSVRRNENGTLLGEILKTVIRGVSTINSSHIGVQPMQAKDEAVWLGVVVVIGDTEDPATLLPVHRGSLRATRKSGILTAASGACVDIFQQCKDKQCTQEEGGRGKHDDK